MENFWNIPQDAGTKMWTWWKFHVWLYKNHCFSSFCEKLNLTTPIFRFGFKRKLKFYVFYYWLNDSRFLIYHENYSWLEPHPSTHIKSNRCIYELLHKEEGRRRNHLLKWETVQWSMCWLLVVGRCGGGSGGGMWARITINIMITDWTGGTQTWTWSITRS